MNFDTRFWQDRPVFITGATGLLGSRLTKMLVGTGASVVVLVRDWVPESELLKDGRANGFTVIRGELTERSVIERVLNEYEISTVFHLAAQTIVGAANRGPISTFESNIAGTWNVLEACRLNPGVKQIVVASSDKAYGTHDELPYSEDAALQGRHPYDVSKSCADLIAQSYAHSFGLPVTITRCGNLYGGGDLNWNRLIPGTIRSAIRGQRPLIRSDGTNIRDYFYVDDAAAAYIRLAELMHERPELNGEAFNFSNEIQVDVLGITRKILELAGRSDLAPDVRDEAKNEILHQYLSARKARELLGWKPEFTLDEGLRLTIEWYKDFLERKDAALTAADTK